MTDEPVNDKAAEESETQEPKVEEPKVEETASSPATPTSSTPTEAGTDQYGRQLYSVKCSSCGNQAQVPFKPVGDRPVYCRDCYMKQRKERMGGGRTR